MVNLYRREDNSLLGAIAEEDLRFLVDQLEEEDLADVDYYVDADTLSFLQDRGAPAALVALLEKALDGFEGVEVYYGAAQAEGAELS